MLTLYVRSGCPYCGKVLLKGAELDLDFNEKNIASEEVAKELEARGGHVQVPYLIDDERGVEMYGSEEIVDYLHEHFGKE